VIILNPLERRTKMEEKNRNDPFRDFIESLDSINGLGGTQIVPIRKSIENYVDSLIIQYGLLPDEEARELLIQIVEDMPNYNTRYFRTGIKQYLFILLWDVFIKEKRPLNVLWTAFLMGVSFGQMIDYEDIPPDEWGAE